MMTFYEQTIIDNIDFSEYKDDPDIYGDYPLYTQIQNVYSIFKKEYVHENNKHISEQTLFMWWLQGLPNILTVPFWNSEILHNANRAAFEFAAVEDEDEFLDSYWLRLAQAFFRLKNNL